MSFPAQSFLYFIQVLTVSRGITPYYYKANSLVLLLYHLYLSLVIERFPIKPPFSRKADAKIRTFLLYFQTFRRVFFQNFQGAPLPFPKAGAKVLTFPITANRTGTFLKVFLYIFVKTLIFSGIKTADFKRQGKGEGQGTPYYIYKGTRDGQSDRKGRMTGKHRLLTLPTQLADFANTAYLLCQRSLLTLPTQLADFANTTY